MYYTFFFFWYKQDLNLDPLFYYPIEPIKTQVDATHYQMFGQCDY